FLRAVQVTAAASSQGRRIAADARQRGRIHVARALDPSLERDGELVAQIVRALRQGDTRDACWKALADNERGSALLVDVASRITELQGDEIEQIDRRGRTTLATVADLYEAVMKTGGVVEPLPALRLAAVLDTRQSIGTLAARLAMARGALEYRKSQSWWRALFAGLTLPRRSGFRSAADRTEAAVTLLWTYAP